MKIKNVENKNITKPISINETLTSVHDSAGDLDAVRLRMPDDPKFPFLLTQIPHPPKKLFVKGTMPPCDRISVTENTKENRIMKYLCVVGARKHSSYGRDMCEQLILGLAGYENICIVSGLALGIDSIAHEAALRANLPTIAIPGSGLGPDVIYPARNQRLAQRIIEHPKGALISEFDMDFRATDWSFPQRNRLMAGISHATMVIEAVLGSGTLITSGLSSDYNRDVFAVPGSVFSKLSEGPHMLINKGAAIITTSEDILHQLGIPLKEKPRAKSNQSDGPLSPLEKYILDILVEPIQKDILLRIICEEKSMHISEANAALSMMEICGLIEENRGLMESRAP